MVHIAACVASLGGISFGYDLAVISGPMLFIQKTIHLSATVEKFVVSSSLVGGLIGALLGGTLADSLGRRKTLILIGFIAIAGDTGSALSPNLPLLVGHCLWDGFRNNHSLDILVICIHRHRSSVFCVLPNS